MSGIRLPFYIPDYGTGIDNKKVAYKEEIVRSGISDIRIDKGATNHTVTLTGYTDVEYSPKPVRLNSAMAYRIMDGKKTYRCEPNEFVRPGDMVTINGETFNIDMISWTADATNDWMEIRES